MRELGLITLSLCFLTACGVAFKHDAEQFISTHKQADWGNPPPEDHLTAESAYIKARLKDPNSAEIRQEAIQLQVISATMSDPAIVPVYASLISVNARNSFGGYTGFKTWTFYYDTGRLFAVENDHGRTYFYKK